MHCARRSPRCVPGVSSRCPDGQPTPVSPAFPARRSLDHCMRSGRTHGLRLERCERCPRGIDTERKRPKAHCGPAGPESISGTVTVLLVTRILLVLGTKYSTTCRARGANRAPRPVLASATLRLSAYSTADSSYYHAVTINGASKIASCRTGSSGRGHTTSRRPHEFGGFSLTRRRGPSGRPCFF